MEPVPRREHVDAARVLPSRETCADSVLFEESFGRVAAEALGVGVPLVASNRGALPETVGDAGILLDVPERLTPTSQEKPTAVDAAPWVDAIISLYDAEARRKTLRQKGL